MIRLSMPWPLHRVTETLLKNDSEFLLRRMSQLSNPGQEAAGAKSSGSPEPDPLGFRY
jgi:hypothetical protein